jgi:hypothetical protein
MALYDRLLGYSEPKIAVHQFQALLAERKRGFATNAEIIAAFGLDVAEQTEVVTLWGRVNSGAVSAAEVHDVFLLGETRTAPYDSVQAVKTRLGV